MAALYGGVEGKARTRATRLGSERSGLRTFAQTWRTFASIEMRADGSGAFAVRDDSGRELFGIGWGPEDRDAAERLLRVKLPGQDEATR